MTTARGLRSVGIAALTALALGGIASCGGPSPAGMSASPAGTAPTAVVEPAQTPALSLLPPQEPRLNASPAGDPTPVPGTEDVFPPEPACPGPLSAPADPVLSASVGGGDPVAGRLGSFTISTCSTVATADMAGGDPETPLVAAPGDEIVVSVAPPWQVAQWEGSDRPIAGDAANAWPPTRLLERPRSFTLGVPPRSGDSILSLDLLLVSADGRAVAQVPVSYLVRVAP